MHASHRRDRWITLQRLSLSRTASLAVVTLAAAGLAVATLGGCAGSSSADDTADEPRATVRLIIADGNLRTLGQSCNGAAPYRFAHAEASYVIQDREGTEVFRGELPTGSAEKILEVDVGADTRQPTTCVMTLEVTGMTEADGHELLIGERPGVPIEPSTADGIAGEAVVS